MRDAAFKVAVMFAWPVVLIAVTVVVMIIAFAALVFAVAAWFTVPFSTVVANGDGSRSLVFPWEASRR